MCSQNNVKCQTRHNIMRFKECQLDDKHQNPILKRAMETTYCRPAYEQDKSLSEPAGSFSPGKVCIKALGGLWSEVLLSSL